MGWESFIPGVAYGRDGDCYAHVLDIVDGDNYVIGREICVVKGDESACIIFKDGVALGYFDDVLDDNDDEKTARKKLGIREREYYPRYRVVYNGKEVAVRRGVVRWIAEELRELAYENEIDVKTFVERVLSEVKSIFQER